MHFASPASPIDFERIPIQILKVGGLGTHNCLGLAKAKGARFFLASTSEVYGDPLVHPQPETYWGNVNPIGPRGRLRRGQALRRGDDDGVPPPPRHRRPHRPHLQHLRAAACGPTTGGSVSNFLVQALAGRADHDLRRRRARPGASATSTTRCGASSPCSTPTSPARSTSATPNEFTIRQLAEMVRRGHRLDVDDRRTSRCRSTTPPSGSRTSPWPAASSGGSP